MRSSFYLLALPVLLAAAMAPQVHRPLDPDEPIAADGSLAAGRARTIFDFEPVLGAFDEQSRRERTPTIRRRSKNT
jgi:hypothetical protein